MSNSLLQLTSANVAKDLIDNRHKESDCGPLFHGMHALVVYRQRTVPGYLVPKFNSHVKLADRVKGKSGSASGTKSMSQKGPAPKNVSSPKSISNSDSGKVVPAGQEAKPATEETKTSTPVEIDAARK